MPLPVDLSTASLRAVAAFAAATLGVACESPSGDPVTAPPKADSPVSSDVVADYPADMWGELTAYAGDKIGNPADEALYIQATGHVNFGAGAAASPFFEATLAEGQLRARRDDVRAALWQALVDQAGDPFEPELSWQDVTFVAPLEQHKVSRRGTPYVRQQFFFSSPLFGAKISGILLIPDGVDVAEPAPAIMYNHYHGGEFWVGTREVDGIWDFFGHGSFGDYFVDQGYVVFAVDAIGFNHRRIDGASRPDEVDATDDDVWDELGFTQQFAQRVFAGKSGRSRFGVRTYEDIVSFRLLQSHPLVDAKRISLIGMSMGCVRSWAMAALIGDQLAAVVALGTFPRWQELAIANIKGAHRNSHFFTGAISDLGLDTESWLLAATTAPMMVVMGNSPLDPQDGKVHPDSPDQSSPGWPSEFAYADAAAETLGEHELRAIARPGLGHTWSVELVDQAVAFLNEHSGLPGPLSCKGLEDGLYCGNDAVAGDPSTLYLCAEQTVSVSAECANGCQIHPPDVNDSCL